MCCLAIGNTSYCCITYAADNTAGNHGVQLFWENVEEMSEIPTEFSETENLIAAEAQEGGSHSGETRETEPENGAEAEPEAPATATLSAAGRPSADGTGERSTGYWSTGHIPGKTTDRLLLKAAEIPSAYDTRDHYEVSAPRDQGTNGNCWAHSAAFCAEEYMVTNYDLRDVDYSELAITYFSSHHPADPLGLTENDTISLQGESYLNLGGNENISAFLLSGWIGASDEENDLSDEMAYNDEAILTQARHYNKADSDLIKQEIMDKGSVIISYYTNTDYYQKDSSGTYYYCSNGLKNPNHQVVVIGWDDTVSPDHFAERPTAAGAWLVRNSWGENWGDGGYFWLSYEDATLGGFTSMSFIPDEEKWDHNYFYDGTPNPDTCRTVATGDSVGNIYRVNGRAESLEAVSIALKSTNVSFEVQVYKKNGDMTDLTDGVAQLSSPMVCTTDAEGIYTFLLPEDETVELREGECFSVVFKVRQAKNSSVIVYADKTSTYSVGSHGTLRYNNATEQGQSFVKRSSGVLTDLSDAAESFRIKAFTDDVTAPEYKVSYVLNGGINSTKNPSSYTEGCLPITLENAARSGYQFAGWYSEPEFLSEVTVVGGDMHTDITLYAKWTANTYSVKFYGNEATSGSMATQKMTYEKSAALAKNAFKRTGYTFTGWNTKADGSGTAYSNGQSVKNLSSKNKATVKLYACWKVYSYTITYELDGGKNSSKNPESYKITSSAITLAEPTRGGYKFAGWYSDAAKTKKVTKITSGSHGNKTFYARWTKIKYSVKYEYNGGKPGGTDPAYYYASSKITLSTPKRTGYVFRGWYTNKSFTGDPVTTLGYGKYGNKTLYAKWAYAKYSIVFDAAGGTGSMKKISGIKYPSSVELTKNSFKKTGYTFTGWNTKKDGSGKSYEDKATVKKLTATDGKTVTLYAQWKQNRYTVKFSGNGATSGSMSSVSSKAYTTKWKLPANRFQRKNYVFSGWTLKADGSGTVYTDGATVSKLSPTDGKKVTLYAKWTPQAYKITYKNTEDADNTRNPKKYYYSDSVSVKLVSPERPGFIFAGWYQEKSLRNRVTSIAAGRSGDLTLWAKWTPDVGWHSFDGGTRYMKSNGKWACGEFVQEGEKLYYIDSNYLKVTQKGFRWINDERYCFRDDTSLYTSSVELTDPMNGVKYMFKFGADGKACRNAEKKVLGKMYVFDQFGRGRLKE